MIQNIMIDQTKVLPPLIYQNTQLCKNGDPYPKIKDTMQKIFNQIFSIRNKDIEQKQQQKQQNKINLNVLIDSYKRLQNLSNQLQKINQISEIKKETKQYEQKRQLQNKKIQKIQRHTQKQKQKQRHILSLTHQSKDLINLISQKKFLQQKLIQINQKQSGIQDSYRILCQHDKQIKAQKAYYWKNKKDMCQIINQGIQSKNDQNLNLIQSNREIQSAIQKQQVSLQNLKSNQIQLYVKINQFYQSNMKIQFNDNTKKQCLNQIAQQQAQAMQMGKDESKQSLEQEQIIDLKEISLSEYSKSHQKVGNSIEQKSNRIKYVSIKPKQQLSLSEYTKKYYLQFIILALITLALNIY